MTTDYEKSDKAATIKAKISIYINSLRNTAKKSYARKYAAYQFELQKHLSTGIVERPEYPGLSYMAAQAVRMNIDEIIEA